MANSTEREPGRFRLEVDNGERVEVDGSTLLDEDTGERVEVDGSTLLDEDTGRRVLAVVLRLPPWRAHALAHVLASWNAAGALFEDVQRVSMDEGDLAWALFAASSAAGDRRAREEGAQRPPTSVPSGRRAAAAGLLREREAFELHTLIAVVDAAAWWLDQPRGDTYCASLLNAVTDQATAGAAYLALVGGGQVEPPEKERSG
jgi:hypothetical protein